MLIAHGLQTLARTSLGRDASAWPHHELSHLGYILQHLGTLPLQLLHEAIPFLRRSDVIVSLQARLHSSYLVLGGEDVSESLSDASLKLARVQLAMCHRALVLDRSRVPVGYLWSGPGVLLS